MNKSVLKATAIIYNNNKKIDTGVEIEINRIDNKRLEIVTAFDDGYQSRHIVNKDEWLEALRLYK